LTNNKCEPQITTNIYLLEKTRTDRGEKKQGETSTLKGKNRGSSRYLPSNVDHQKQKNSRQGRELLHLREEEKRRRVYQEGRM